MNLNPLKKIREDIEESAKNKFGKKKNRTITRKTLLGACRCGRLVYLTETIITSRKKPSK